MKPRVLVLAPFAAPWLSKLAESCDVVHEDWRHTGRLQDPEALGARLRSDGFLAVIVEADFLFEETFAAAPGLKFAGICRAATNQVDVAAATRRGVIVVNTPGRNAVAVAELTVGLMFALARRIPEADSYVRSGRWESPTAAYTGLRGMELAGRTAGVIGFGALGRAVGTLCQAIGMRVVAHDPVVPPEEITATGARPLALEALLGASDFITLHARTTGNDGALLNEATLKAVRRGSYLVNTASPGLVDQHALVQLLRSGHLRGAAIDVFETHPIEPSHPLLGLDNVILTPHIGGATDETIDRHSEAMATALLSFLAGKRPRNLVNPEAWKGSGQRE